MNEVNILTVTEIIIKMFDKCFSVSVIDTFFQNTIQTNCYTLPNLPPNLYYRILLLLLNVLYCYLMISIYNYKNLKRLVNSIFVLLRLLIIILIIIFVIVKIYVFY